LKCRRELAFGLFRHTLLYQHKLAGTGFQTLQADGRTVPHRLTNDSNAR
jgi:hypothetical protein